MKIKFRTLFLLLAVCLAAFSLTACGDPDAIVGEGGIVPTDGYKQIQVENSSFYVPENSTYIGKQNGLDIYNFADGTFNINVVDSSTKIQRLSKSSFKKTLNKEMKANNIEYSLDSYKFYKLSDLWILADELTLTLSNGQVIKEFQFSYNIPKKQVTVTIAYNNRDVAADADFPQKLLYSISVK